ncbi:hypothetical protein G6F65_019645 [Rhizopus arrhizus]|nr:hypothetical protein G6F65_019645 [Rhizopus arrhizus]
MARDAAVKQAGGKASDREAVIRALDIPYNPLHDQGYPSIGCEPCTRAIRPGEDLRAGRWWWESSDSKECGLHAGNRVISVGNTYVCCDPTQPPGLAGIGSDIHLARGRRRKRKPRVAVFGRQGLCGAAAPGRKGLPPRALSVPAHAHRYRA